MAAAPILLRAQQQGDRTVVRVLMAHEMESGQRKDGDGRPIPAWHIQDVAVTLEGRPVLTLRFGPSVSKNPFLRFALRGGRAGQRVAVSWVDTRGERRSAEAVIA
ncbi:thiosulfate oxidation carrier complex protein SoxZ [Rubrivivax gelatinosus]|jgi:sulfur-oxidizing protein SoxZ|uniref:Sulfur-oxidizing protein SoxZ n=1 Tax=Rubrivivax gelatinosus TaxID=28068 RepID=A0A4R2MDI1_RUBGE|nr:thiosulfate oxidation carrier complex protein SoxZ [Rubrivivax gelatinosus]MBK1688551.1 thiosulfate oxidation carrier complex protein SoxZ [Rubrivivax gelatinosus]TCP04680.1 sulfur-oxidizing protein SoxZ [Rubrivivax gelatinosus]